MTSREREEKPQTGTIYLQKTHLLYKEFLMNHKKKKNNLKMDQRPQQTPQQRRCTDGK